MNPNKDFEELFELLNRNKVKYLLVGGYAYAHHPEKPKSEPHRMDGS